MSVVEPGSPGASLIQRVQDILLRPKPTWDQIDAEPATIADLYKSYVVPLAAIPAVCTAIGSSLLGTTVLGVTMKTPIVTAIVTGIVGFVLGLVMVYVTALIINFLAPNFGGTSNKVQAFKVVAYSNTATWVAGLFGLVPAAAPLILLAALYGLYLMYLGLPKLMKTVEDRAVPYIAVSVIVSFVIFLVVGGISASIAGATMGLGALGRMAGSEVSGKINTPGGSVDLGKLQAASKQLEAAAKQMESGKAADGSAVTPTDPEVLKAYLPASVAGFTRGEVSSGSGGVGGVDSSNVEAKYSRGEARLDLTITDLGAAGALGALAGAFNIRSSKEEGGKYEKIGRVDGRMTEESFDSNSKHGEYSVLAGDRFMIHAVGDNVSVDDLKAAVAAVNPERVEQLAKAG